MSIVFDEKMKNIHKFTENSMKSFQYALTFFHFHFFRFLRPAFEDAFILYLLYNKNMRRITQAVEGVGFENR